MVRMRVRPRSRTPGGGSRFLLPKFMRCRLPCIQYADSDAGSDLQNDSLLDDHELHDDGQPLTNSNSSSTWRLGHTRAPAQHPTDSNDIDSNSAFDSIHEQNNVLAVDSINSNLCAVGTSENRAGTSNMANGNSIDNDSQFTDRNNCKLPNFRPRMWRNAFTGYDKNMVPEPVRQNTVSTSTSNGTRTGFHDEYSTNSSAGSFSVMDDSMTLLDNSFVTTTENNSQERNARREAVSGENSLMCHRDERYSNESSSAYSGRDLDTARDLLINDTCDTTMVLPVDTELFSDRANNQMTNDADDPIEVVGVCGSGVATVAPTSTSQLHLEHDDADLASVDDETCASSAASAEPPINNTSMGLQAALLDFLNGGLPTSSDGQNVGEISESSGQASGNQTATDTMGSGHSSSSSNSDLLRQILHSLHSQVTYAGSVRMRSPDSSQSSSNHGSLNQRHQQNWYFYDPRLGSNTGNTSNDATALPPPPVTSLPSAAGVVSPPTYEEAQAQVQLLKIFQSDIGVGASGHNGASSNTAHMPTEPPPPYLLPEVGVPPPAYSDNGSEHSSLGEVPPYRSHPNSQASGATSASGSIGSRSLNAMDITGSSSTESTTRLSPPRGRLLLFNQGHSLLSFVNGTPWVTSPPEVSTDEQQQTRLSESNEGFHERLISQEETNTMMEGHQLVSDSAEDPEQSYQTPTSLINGVHCSSPTVTNREENVLFHRRSGSGQSTGPAGFRPAVRWNRGMGLDRWAPTQSWASEFRLSQ